jgi:hypothetical protein
MIGPASWRTGDPSQALTVYLAERCASVNEGENLSLDVGNIELRIIPGDSVELPHLEPPLDAIVVFAGSNDILDWIRNATVRLRACRERGGRVHTGFEGDFRRVRGKLLERLHGFKRVAIAGHSRAHPLACRLAEDLDDLGFQVAFVLTFGGPRWCDAARRDCYNARGISTFRFVVGWDAVPRWPRFGYRHVGRMICLDGGGARLDSQRRPSWRTPWKYLWRAVGDHGLADQYVRAVRAWAESSR